MQAETMELPNLASYQVDRPIVDPDEQAREEWYKKRSGKFTCSKIGLLAGSGRAKDAEFTKQGYDYIYQVAAERKGSYSFPFESGPTRWGKDNESEAIEEYCDLSGVDSSTVETGVDCYRELCDYLGGTPDALIGNKGTAECKCPFSPAQHMRWRHQGGVPAEHLWQVNGHMLVTNREWCDFISFDPRISGPERLYVVRTERDEGVMKLMRERIDQAEEEVKRILGG